MSKRISRNTPYILSGGDIDNYLASLTPRTEQAIASLLGMEVTAWREQTKAVKAKQIVDFQNAGVGAAALAASAKAQQDLEDVAFGPTQKSHDITEELVELIAEKVTERLAKPRTTRARKGA